MLAKNNINVYEAIEKMREEKRALLLQFIDAGSDMEIYVQKVEENMYHLFWHFLHLRLTNSPTINTSRGAFFNIFLYILLLYLLHHQF